MQLLRPLLRPVVSSRAAKYCCCSPRLMSAVHVRHALRRARSPRPNAPGRRNDEHGVLAKPLTWLEREQRLDVVDSLVDHGLEDAEIAEPAGSASSSFASTP